MYYHAYYVKSPVRFIAVPYWVAKTLASKGLSLSAVKDFKIMQDIFSAEMLAQLATVQEVARKATDLTDSEQLFIEWGKGATLAQITELDSVIRPLSSNVVALQELEHRLSKESADFKEGDYFDLSSLGRDTCVAVLKPGFLDYISESDLNRLEFLRGCVAQLYVHTSHEQVASSHIYRLYVDVLSTTLTSEVAE